MSDIKEIMDWYRRWKAKRKAKPFRNAMQYLRGNPYPNQGFSATLISDLPGVVSAYRHGGHVDFFDVKMRDGYQFSSSGLLGLDDGEWISLVRDIARWNYQQR